LVAGLCRTDVYAARGALPCAPSTVLGHEAAGVLLELSPGTCPSAAHAHALAHRTLVAFQPFLGCQACVACVAGRPHHCAEARMLGLGRDGVFAEEVVLPLTACVPLPGVSDARVAAFLEPVAAALAVAHAGLPTDARVLVLGGSRIARLTERVLLHEGYEHVTRAMRLPPGARFDVGVETRADEASLGQLAGALRPGGTLVLKSRPATRVPVDLAAWVQRDLLVRGVSYAPFPLAAARLADPALDVSAWLGELHSFEDFCALLSREPHAMTPDASELPRKPLLACTSPACVA
jgi:threonine dehydrogenase-like Zn-dependent dehydrogenase